MREKILAFLHSLILYDYILFGAIFSLFLFFIILAILKRENLLTAIFLILFSFIILFIGPIIGYKVLHIILYKSSVELVSQKKLQFLSAVVVKAKLHNESNFNFKECKVTANVHKASSNAIKDYIYSFKTIKKAEVIKHNIDINQTVDVKIIIEPFDYKKRYKISLNSECK
jgi:hypothetical protein